MIFEKFFLQLLLILFEETFCINKFKLSRRGKSLKSSILTYIAERQYHSVGLGNHR